jgi:membrane protein involved in colicin uptake
LTDSFDFSNKGIERERLMEQEQKEAEEELTMRGMTSEERNEYIRQKIAEEKERKKRAEEEKKRREEERMRALNEVKRLAQEEAKRKAELLKRMSFMQSVRSEGPKLEASQSVNRAFVYSYFQLVDSVAEKLDMIKAENSEKHINDKLGINPPPLPEEPIEDSVDPNAAPNEIEKHDPKH